MLKKLVVLVQIRYGPRQKLMMTEKPGGVEMRINTDIHHISATTFSLPLLPDALRDASSRAMQETLPRGQGRGVFKKHGNDVQTV